jgi:hypothetical protein
MPTASARSLFNRPRWTEEDAREVISALERSGKTVSAFAEERGIDPQRVYLWRRRLGGVAAQPRFQEVLVRSSLGQPEGGHTSPWFEIGTGSGYVVRVPTSFDAASLRRLLEVLAAAGAC